MSCFVSCNIVSAMLALVAIVYKLQIQYQFNLSIQLNFDKIQCVPQKITLGY